MRTFHKNRYAALLLGLVVTLPTTLALVACQTQSHSQSETEVTPQRVVLVTIDTLRADHLGLYGYPRATTSFLDRLAGDGVWFASARSTCSHTAPSHASLFTGLYPAEHGVRINGENLDPRITTLAELYQQAGYKTAAFSTIRFLSGIDSGFEHQHYEKKYRGAHRIIQAAWSFIERQPVETPLFLWVHLFDVHEWHRPNRVSRRGKRTLLEDPNLSGRQINQWIEHRYASQDREGNKELLGTLFRYDAQLIHVDQQLGWFFDQMEQQPAANNTLWLVTSDHGEGLHNHGRRGHGEYLHREQLEVPLIVRWPEAGWNGGRKVTGLVQHVDVAKTLAELVPGELTPGEVANISLTPLLTGQQASSSRQTALALRRPKGDDRRRAMWAEDEVVAIENDRIKIVGALREADGSERDLVDTESFDLSSDPFERAPVSLGPMREPSPAEASMMKHLKTSFESMFERAPKGPGVDQQHLDELRELGYLSTEDDP